jgi:hypothetical protein
VDEIGVFIAFDLVEIFTARVASNRASNTYQVPKILDHFGVVSSRVFNFGYYIDPIHLAFHSPGQFLNASTSSSLVLKLNHVTKACIYLTRNIDGVCPTKVQPGLQAVKCFLRVRANETFLPFKLDGEVGGKTIPKF